MLTAEQLQSIMPGLSAKRNGEFLPFLQAAMTEFAIEAPARAAAFLAQLAHESGQFRFMEEIWGPTAAQRRYEPPSSLATTLGNTEAGDGKRFKGRGPIQITGRANYGRFGDLLGVELTSDPARAAVPDLAFRIAGLFWSKKGLNELADRATADAFRETTRRINGGFNGLEDRKKFYAAACTVLGVSEVPAERGLPVPDAAEEPAFDRGYEAIRRHVPKARRRKTPPATRKTSSGRAKADTRRAKTGSRKAKTSSRGKTRKVAAAPRRASSRSRVKTTAAGRSAAATARKTAGARRSKARSAAQRRKPARRKS